MFLNYIVSFDGILSMQAKFFVVVCHKIGNKVFFHKECYLHMQIFRLKDSWSNSLPAS